MNIEKYTKKLTTQQTALNDALSELDTECMNVNTERERHVETIEAAKGGQIYIERHTYTAGLGMPIMSAEIGMHLYSMKEYVFGVEAARGALWSGKTNGAEQL